MTTGTHTHLCVCVYLGIFVIIRQSRQPAPTPKLGAACYRSDTSAPRNAEHRRIRRAELRAKQTVRVYRKKRKTADSDGKSARTS